MVQGVPIVDNQIVNLNPATGQEISRIDCTTADEIDRLMERASQAHQTVWGHMSAKERIQFIRKGLEQIARQSDEFIPLIVKEMGKPLGEAQVEMDGVSDKEAHLRIIEEMSEPIYHGTNNIVVRQSLGVVVILSPWNFPCDEILLLTVPALAAGNTVIVKPSEVAPETGALTVQTLASVLPDSGILQLAQGDGTVGAALVAHTTPALVAMTGSSRTGRAILQQAAAPKLKRIILELGGKDPMVVFADCPDIALAAHDAVKYSVYNAGQVCCSIERVYVAETIYNEFVAAVMKEAATYNVGNGLDPNNNVGPLVSTMQRDKVAEQVQDAVAKGARLLYQSDIPSEGSFYPVTVLGEVQHGMKVYHEETFGPVVCLSKFDGSEEEAVRLANDTEYGLASSVYTSDLAKATRVAGRIDAGQVGINCYSIENMHEACPWVGHKNSGIGFHSGKEGFLNFSIPKTIVYDGCAPGPSTVSLRSK